MQNNDNKLLYRNFTRRHSPLVAALLLGFGMQPAIGAPVGGATQPLPDAGLLLQTVRPELPQPARPATPLIQVAPTVRPPLRAPAGFKVKVNGFRFTGNSVFSERELAAVVSGDIGKELDVNGLEQAAAEITRFYRAHGYFVARAYLPEQQIQNGIIEIAVLEGRLDHVRIKRDPAGLKVSSSVIDRLVKGAMPPGEVISVKRLERGLLLVNDLPQVDARSTLVPGASVGTSDLIVEANQSKWATNSVDIDNAGNRYTGQTRLGTQLNLNSPTGMGDQLTLRAVSSFDGMNYGRLSWMVPVGAQGTKAGAAYTYTNYKLGGSLAALGAAGDAEIGSLFTVTPFVRSRDFNLYGTFNYDHKRLFDKTYVSTVSDRQLDVASYGIGGDVHDQWLGGGLNSFSLTATTGHVNRDAYQADAQQDAQHAQTGGTYDKLSYQAFRQQQLPDNFVLYGSVTGQVASKNLDSSEAFSLGGISGVRAYPTNEAVGDAGFVGTVELRYNVPRPVATGSLQLKTFYDYGHIQLHKFPWAGALDRGTGAMPNQYNLQGAGVGLNLFKPDSYLISAAVAWKVGSNPAADALGNDSDGSNRHARFWLQGIKYF